MGKGFTREDAIKELAKRLGVLREGETGRRQAGCASGVRAQASTCINKGRSGG